MTAITGSTQIQQPLLRIFDHIDADKDDAISLSELKATESGASDEQTNTAFGNLDRNGDGKISRPEMPTSAFLFSPETLKTLVAFQIRTAAALPPVDRSSTPAPAAADTPTTSETAPATPRTRPQPPTTWAPSFRAMLGRGQDLPERPAYVKTEEEQRLTADFFARADINDDGLISQDEWKVERSLVRKATAETGLASKIMFLPQDHDSDGMITPDEMGIGHVGILKPSNIRFFGERSVAEQDAMIATREQERARMEDFNTRFPAYAKPLPPSLQRESAETAREKRQAFEAEYARKVSAPEGYYRLSESHLTMVRNLKPVIDTPALSDLLAARLMRQTLAGLNTKPADPAKSTTA